MSRRPPRPVLVAIVGGSGSGKSWLADQLHEALSPKAARLSQDDFYHDRSHLSPARRQRLNFDHPRAIDWEALEAALRSLLTGRSTTIQIPQYNFVTHCRDAARRTLPCKPVVILDGLWLLRRPTLRTLFDLSIFLDCPAATRLARRLARDQHSRGRTERSIRKQFASTVEPMHRRFVDPQRRWANVVFERPCDSAALDALSTRIRNLLK